MLKAILVLLMVVYISADNSISIKNYNENVTIDQQSYNYGTNSIYIGDNNRQITINQTIEIKKYSNKILLNIKESLKNLSLNKNKISNDFQKLLKKSDAKLQQKINKLHDKFNKISSFDKDLKNKIASLKLDIDNVININNIEIEKLKKRILIIESDVAFLMDQFNRGNLNSVSFYKLYVEGTYINSTFYKGVGFGYERLYNSSTFQGLSLVVNLSTLSGVESSIIKDLNKEFYLFDIGVKKPFSTLLYPYNLYTKGSVGYLWGDEKSLFFKVGAGVEKYNKKNKISLAINYLAILEKENQIVKTYLLGSAQVTTNKEYQHGISLELSISFTTF